MIAAQLHRSEAVISKMEKSFTSLGRNGVFRFAMTAIRFVCAEGVRTHGREHLTISSFSGRFH